MMYDERKNSRKILEAWTGPGKKDGTITPFKPEHDALHIDMNKRGNIEWWYFDARLDNGYTVVVFFRAKHERTGKTGVELVIYKPTHEKIQKIYNYKRSDFTASLQQAEVKIGKNYIHVDYSNEKFPSYEIYLDEGEHGVHLNYTATVPSWMPGKGYTRFGNLGVFGWVIPLPLATVQGKIKINGKEMSVKGMGYHDHNWLDFNPIKIIDYWMWGRMYSDNFTLIYAFIKCNKKWGNYPIKVLMLAKDGEILESTGEYELVQEDFRFNEKIKSTYPNKLIFQIPENNRVELNVQQIIDSDNLLFELNPVVRFIVKNILKLNPCYFRFFSQFKMQLNIENKSHEEEGATFHEMVILR